MSPTIQLLLPWPPSVNHYWGQAGKHRFIGKRGKEFRKAVAEACIEAAVEPLEGRLAVHVNLYPPDRRKRIDCSKSRADRFFGFISTETNTRERFGAKATTEIATSPLSPSDSFDRHKRSGACTSVTKQFSFRARPRNLKSISQAMPGPTSGRSSIRRIATPRCCIAR